VAQKGGTPGQGQALVNQPGMRWLIKVPRTDGRQCQQNGFWAAGRHILFLSDLCCVLRGREQGRSRNSSVSYSPALHYHCPSGVPHSPVHPRRGGQGSGLTWVLTPVSQLGAEGLARASEIPNLLPVFLWLTHLFLPRLLLFCPEAWETVLAYWF
jgi:hypothetical protein